MFPGSRGVLSYLTVTSVLALVKVQAHGQGSARCKGRGMRPTKIAASSHTMSGGIRRCSDHFKNGMLGFVGASGTVDILIQRESDEGPKTQARNKVDRWTATGKVNLLKIPVSRNENPAVALVLPVEAQGEW